jgi:hypothetical protein
MKPNLPPTPRSPAPAAHGTIPRPGTLLLFLLCLFIAAAAAQARSAKRGICYGYHAPADLAAISPGVSWWYNWTVTPETGVVDVYRNYSMEFVPMAWNGGFDAARLRSFLKTHPDVKYILGFNEPNFVDQADMPPTAAAAAWPALEAIADEFSLKIVGPAVNFCGNCVAENGTTYTDPVKYLDDFFTACPDCRVDYIAVHNYMCYRSALTSYLGNFYKYGRKIWLTEFACWDQPASTVTPQFQINYMNEALTALENDTMVFRYAWFIGRTGAIDSYPYQSIFGADPGSLTALGSQYVNHPAATIAARHRSRTAPADLRLSRGSWPYAFTLSGSGLVKGSAPDITVANCAGRTVPIKVALSDESANVRFNPTGAAPGMYAVSVRLHGCVSTFMIVMDCSSYGKTIPAKPPS